MRHQTMEQSFLELIKAMGEDPAREGLRDTPKRAAKTLQFLTRGYKQHAEKLIKNAIFTCDKNEIVIVKNIELYSLCEHHLLPFIGTCHVAYLPNGKLMGLNAFPRLVNLYACRLQIQERLTLEIAQCVAEATQAQGVGVTIEAKHLCMAMRSVKEQNASLKTSVRLGCFHTDPQAKADLLSLMQ